MFLEFKVGKIEFIRGEITDTAGGLLSGFTVPRLSDFVSFVVMFFMYCYSIFFAYISWRSLILASATLFRAYYACLYNFTTRISLTILMIRIMRVILPARAVFDKEIASSA